MPSTRRESTTIGTPLWARERAARDLRRCDMLMATGNYKVVRVGARTYGTPTIKDRIAKSIIMGEEANTPIPLDTVRRIRLEYRPREVSYATLAKRYAVSKWAVEEIVNMVRYPPIESILSVA